MVKSTFRIQYKQLCREDGVVGETHFIRACRIFRWKGLEGIHIEEKNILQDHLT